MNSVIREILRQRHADINQRIGELHAEQRIINQELENGSTPANGPALRLTDGTAKPLHWTQTPEGKERIRKRIAEFGRIGRKRRRLKRRKA